MTVSMHRILGRSLPDELIKIVAHNLFVEESTHEVNIQLPLIYYEHGHDHTICTTNAHRTQSQIHV